MKKVGISMPVANEEKSIRDFLGGLLKELSGLENNYTFVVYIIMDSFSKDKTFDIVKEVSEYDSRVKLIFFNESTGGVSCFLKGFKCALSDGCDYIIEMDSGFSHPPSKIKDILYALDAEDYDIVFMSRFMKGSGIKNFPLYRRILSRGGSILANLWLGTNFSDATSGFEAFKAKVLGSFNLDAFISAGSIYSTEMKYYCKDYRYKEIPFTYVASTSAFKFKFIWIALRTLTKLKDNKKRIHATV